MWRLHQMCQMYRLRPSDVIGIDDRWLAFDFDDALTTFAVIVQNRLDETDKQGRHKHDVYSALNLPKPLKRVNLAMFAQFGNVVIKE